jgi:putative transposase
MSIAYAFVDGQWLTCTADTFLQVQGRSEREWELILDEWREQQRAHHHKRMSMDSSRLAAFLQEVLTEEALLSRQQRDLEGASIREAIVGQAKTTPIAPSTCAGSLVSPLEGDERKGRTEGLCWLLRACVGKQVL